MVENPEAMTMLKSSYEANPAISEAVTNILHSSDLTSLSALAHRDETSREKEPRVKRPMNAFMLYAQVARRKVATKYPNLNYAKLSKTLGKIWQVLPEEERRPFIQEAERLRTQHKLKHPDYKYTPKRLKAKKHGAPMKKARLDNLKPEDLFNIIQAKCDPGSLQLSTSPNGYPARYDEQFPMYSENNNNNFDNPLYTGQTFDPLTPFNNFDSQFQGLEYLSFPNRRFNGLCHSEMAPNNDVKSFFPDYNENQILDTFNNPNSPLAPKPNPLNANQPLSTFLTSKPESSTTLTPLTNTFGEGLSFSKLIDPIENISSFLEGKSQLPGYVAI